MAEWSHLPNAVHIDRILADLKARPEVWAAARDAAWAAARAAVRDAAWVAARVAARDAAWVAARDAARDAAWVATRDAAWVAAWVATRAAVGVLVAWDDCAYMLDLSPDAVRMLMHTGDETTRHQAVLLLPAVIALHT